MHLGKVNNIHFIGIGGIGMSALAKYFIFKGINVSGYDKTQTSLTNELSRLGAIIHFQEDLELVPFINEIDLVVYTPAISKNHSQLLFFRQKKIPVLKRAKVLGLITKEYVTIAVAGTHGKTTCSSIAAHILSSSEKIGVAFLGGLATNYNSNVILSNKNLAVVEADEYDRSFLELTPSTILLTSVDADHLDIYEKKVNVEKTFLNFVKLVKNKKKLIVEEGLKSLVKDCLTYGFSANADLRIVNILIKENHYNFDFVYKNKKYEGFKFKLPGKHNLLNAIGASFSCLLNGVSFSQIRDGLATFSGVKRRFEIYLENPDYVVLDDYAHHPKEIDVLISAIREFFPNRYVKGIFQPHLFSRTRDFMKEFASSLSNLDELFLLPIYPAREQPIEGISSGNLLKQVNLKNKFLVKKHEDFYSKLLSKKSTVIVTIGAGDVDLHLKPTIDLIQKNV